MFKVLNSYVNDSPIGSSIRPQRNGFFPCWQTRLQCQLNARPELLLPECLLTSFLQHLNLRVHPDFDVVSLQALLACLERGQMPYLNHCQQLSCMHTR